MKPRIRERHFLRDLVQKALRLLGVEQNRSRAPPIFHRQRVDFPEDAGKARFRETIEGNHADMLAADSWFNASAEVLRGQKLIQIDGNVRQREGVIFSRHATPEIAKQPVLNLREAVIVHELMPVQPRSMRKSAENTFSNISTRDLNRSRI